MSRVLGNDNNVHAFEPTRSALQFYKDHSVVVTPHSLPYYALCFVGGGLASSIRWIKTPLDNVKCNMQVSPSRYPNFHQGLAVIYRAEGMSGLYRGLIPTIMAYGSQTGIKYGMYEVIKDQITQHVDTDTAESYRGLIYVLAAASAESIADIFMCPWEMLKVRVQTDPTFPKAFAPGLKIMRADKSFPFGSLLPLLARQLPSTVVNFFTFEHTVNAIYKHVLSKPKSDCGTGTQLGVTLAAGYVAGLTSTVASHIPDNLISLKARPEFSRLGLLQMVRQVGLWRLATYGLGPRVAMTGSIIGFQWLFYDSFKTSLGLGTTGGE